MSCTVEGCDRSGKITAARCTMHYQRFKKTGSDGPAAPARRRGAVCSLPDCTEAHYGHGYCKKHCRAFVRWGDPRADRTQRKGTCTLCGLPQQARGFCGMHYQRWQKYGDPSRERATLEQRVMANIDRSAGPDDCWPWQGALGGSAGHGQTSLNRKVVYAHRVVYELTNGPIPDGLIVRHTCDNPPCCNPAHLLTGTQFDNVQDMISRGRAHWQKGSAA
jgi:hypothetical protein